MAQAHLGGHFLVPDWFCDSQQLGELGKDSRGQLSEEVWRILTFTSGCFLYCRGSYSTDVSRPAI